MPKPRKLDRWQVRGYPGWIFNRGGIAYHRLGNAMESLRIPFSPEYEKLGMEYLEKRRDAYAREQARRLLGLEEAPKRREMVTLDDLVTAFETATYPHIGVNQANNYKRPIAYYLDFNLEWNRADKEERERAGELILTALERRHNAEGLAANTRRKYVGHLRHVFDWMVERKHLNDNPAAKLRKPTKLRGTRRTRWTLEECEAIIAALEKRLSSPYDPLFIRFLMLTGMRPGEALKITREQAASDYLPATGKGATRELPVAILPGLREVIDRALALAPVPGRRWLLFPWSSLTNPRTRFNDAVIAAEIARRERTLYGLRKTAIWWMEHDLLMHRQDIFDMVGHDEDVDDEHYREHPAGPDLEDRIRRRRGSAGAVADVVASAEQPDAGSAAGGITLTGT